MFDSTPEGRVVSGRSRVHLLYLFVLGVAAGSLSGFFGHVFTPDADAESIDWPKGDPFQQGDRLDSLVVSERTDHASMSGLLGCNVLVIEQKPKFVELTNEYRVLDETGNEIGVIRQEGQSKARKLLRLVSSIDQFLTHRLSMYDAAGVKVLDLVRPAKVLKSRVQVLDGAGTERGWIVQENVVGKKRFGLQGTGGERLGSINAENWRSWDFAIEDSGGREVGRITKRWAGILREGFTTADRYLLHVATEVPTDLRLLMFASAAGIDTALKQDDTGGFGFGGIDLDI